MLVDGGTALLSPLEWPAASYADYLRSFFYTLSRRVNAVFLVMDISVS
jgi:hypothetical protein